MKTRVPVKVENIDIKEVRRCAFAGCLTSLIYNENITFLSRNAILNNDKRKEEYGSYVYLLFKNNILCYIGKSTVVVKRIYQHRQKKDFDFVVLLPVSFSDMNSIEGLIIRTFKTIYNRCAISEKAASFYAIPKELGFKKSMNTGKETWGSFWDA